jgi:hypothetical protein
MVPNSRKHSRIANIYQMRNYNTATQIWGQQLFNSNVLMKKKTLYI